MKGSGSVRFGPWAGRKYFLDKMTMRDLVGAYFTHYAIMAYLVLSVATGAYALTAGGDPLRLALAALLVVPVYPLAWYALHRWVLHGQWLYKLPATARLWKRIHFDHHRDPHDLVVTVPLGWVIGGGPAGAAAAVCSGLLTTCVYEFVHCVQRLPFTPRWGVFKLMKKLHLAHHFHNEQGNYGITNFW